MRAFFRLLWGKSSTIVPPPSSRRTMSTSSTAILYAATVAAPTLSSSRPDDEITAKKSWHVKGGYENPWPSWHDQSAFSIITSMIWRNISGKSNKPDTKPPTVPVQSPTFLQSRESSPKLRATWLGHACYYVEFPSGLRVLFDPVFTDRCSPFSFMGPKRYTEAPCQIKDIPTIDAVVISHNHYDHLSHPTVTEIAERHPGCHFFVPIGNKQWFTATGIKQCTELDWWESTEFTLTPSAPEGKRVSVGSASDSSNGSSKTITAQLSALPAQHMSARSPTDKAKTLWASWSVKSGNKSVYFGGDTGYRSVPYEADGKDDYAEEYASLPRCPAFKDIGKLVGPFDLGLIPIGAYHPRWLFSPMHADPRDAVEIFRDTLCKRAMGIHWGTWVLTEEDVLEPPRLLKKALAHHQIPETGVFDVCDIGESRDF
jgi:L-ascorbate metabolism protein UlaG (beta-lactamase superfamily)